RRGALAGVRRPEGPGVANVEARRGLVEEEHPWRVQHAEGEAGALADRGREVLGPLALGVDEREALAQRVPAALQGVTLEPEQAGVELDVLAQREALVEAHPLPHVAAVIADPPGPRHDVDAVHLDRAGRR